MKSFLAFDLGASSGRGIIGKIVNGKLDLQEIHRFKNFPMEKNRHFYWNFEALFSEICTGIQKACAADSEIESLSVDTWGVDYAMFRNGKPIRTPYCYRDGRTEQAMTDLHKIVSKEELYQATGIQLMSFNTIYQLFAHKQEFPEDFTDGAFMLHMPDALIYMLTGTATTEYTIASTGAMLSPETRDWNFPLLKKVGIPQEILRPVVMPSTSAGTLKLSLCQKLGVPALKVVKCGSHDTASAVAATPCTADMRDRLYISMGTWALLGAELDVPKADLAAYRAHYTNEGGLLGKIRFLVNIMGTWLLQEAKRNWNEAGRDIGFAEISQMGASVAENKFRFDPNDSSFFQPCNMPEKIREYCRKTGQGEIPSDAVLVRCIYDSLADCFQKMISELEHLLGTKYTALHILGGGTQDEFFMGLIAKRTGLTVVAGPKEATAVGNLLSQLLASGELHSLKEARTLVKDSFPTKEYLAK